MLDVYGFCRRCNLVGTVVQNAAVLHDKTKTVGPVINDAKTKSNVMLEVCDWKKTNENREMQELPVTFHGQHREKRKLRKNCLSIIFDRIKRKKKTIEKIEKPS